MVTPLWYNVTMGIFGDEEAHKAWNWVLEMYGYTLATYKAGQHVGLKTHINMLAHPPFDKTEVIDLLPFDRAMRSYDLPYIFSA